MDSKRVKKALVMLKDFKNKKTDSNKSIYTMDRMPAREKDVFQLIKKGLTSKECALALKLSVRTVEVHRANLIQKYRVKNIVELVYLMKKHA